MVPVMYRKIAMVALLGSLAAGLGCCHHIGGKSDCGYNPSDYPIGPPTPPYPSALPSSVPPDQIPKSINKTSGEAFDIDKLGVVPGSGY
jgi:hypothetical protein